MDKDVSGTRFRGTDCESRITQLYGDSATYDFSRHVGTVDLVFVDGSHSYEYVVSDSRLSLSLLRGGKGVIGMTTREGGSTEGESAEGGEESSEE